MSISTLLLSSEVLDLQGAEDGVRNGCEGTGELEANISTEGVGTAADELANGTDKPHLSHSHHAANNAKAERTSGASADGQ